MKKLLFLAIILNCLSIFSALTPRSATNLLEQADRFKLEAAYETERADLTQATLAQFARTGVKTDIANTRRFLDLQEKVIQLQEKKEPTPDIVEPKNGLRDWFQNAGQEFIEAGKSHTIQFILNLFFDFIKSKLESPRSETSANSASSASSVPSNENPQ